MISFQIWNRLGWLALITLVLITIGALVGGRAKAQEANASYWVSTVRGESPATITRHGRKVAARYDGGTVIGPTLLRTAMSDLGRGKFTPYSGAWCRDALNVWLRRAGFHTDTDRRAIAARRLGPRVSPTVGAIGVQRHHVGIVAEVVRGGVIMVSGNSGHRVREAFYPFGRFVGFVRPT